jgi:hypothetical protein
VQGTGKPGVETIQPVLEAARSGDLFKIRSNSDTAYWPATGVSLRRQIASLDLSLIDIRPAGESPQANLLARLCGTEVLRVSWWANVKAEDGVNDYFLVKRGGRWLVWLSVYAYEQFH